MPRVADPIEWAGHLEMRGFEKMAELATASGYCASGYFSDAVAAKRDHPYSLLLGPKGSWARVLRKTLESVAAPPTQSRKQYWGNFASASGGGDPPPEAFFAGRTADPPNIPFLAPKLCEASWPRKTRCAGGLDFAPKEARKSRWLILKDPRAPKEPG